jgi:hypothetical protein
MYHSALALLDVVTLRICGAVNLATAGEVRDPTGERLKVVFCSNTSTLVRGLPAA